jgi:hypothetical protein
MKLTKKDKELLIKRGYQHFELTEIENSRFRYEMFWHTNVLQTAIQVSQKQAIKLLGREEFISGIARATYHDAAVRYIKDLSDGSRICGIYFKNKK